MNNTTTVESGTVSTCFGHKYKDDVAYLMKHKAKELNHIYKTYQGFWPLPLALLGLTLSAIYFFAVLRAVKQHRVSRKCYVLLLNRSFGDCFACVIAIIASTYNLSVPVVSRETTQLIDVLFMASIWSAMVSYVALSLIKLYAVWKPLDYRNRVTMQGCIYLIAFSWLVFAAFAAYAVGVLALTRIPVLNAWSGCRLETCVRYMYRVRNGAVVCAYIITIVCFCGTVILIRRAQRFMRVHHRKTTKSTEDGSTRRPSLKERFPLWKLAVSVGTFTVFNCLYPIFAGSLLFLTLDKCFFLHHFNDMMRVLGCVRMSLLLRTVIDPIVSFFTDLSVRRSVIMVFNLQHKVEPMNSRKRLYFGGRSNPSEDNSSEHNPRISTKSSYVPDRASVYSKRHDRTQKPNAKSAAAAAAPAVDTAAAAEASDAQK